MNQVLPKSYIFNNQYVFTPLGVNSGFWDRIQVWQVWVILGAIFLLGFLFIKNSRSQDSVYALKLKMSGKSLIVLGIVALIFCTGFSTNMINPSKFNQSLRRPYAEDCVFTLKLGSNVYVKQDKLNYPGTMNQMKGYPYSFYTIDNQDLIYLGKVKDNKIYFNKSNKAGKLFSKYYSYIKKHHLEKKFKHDIHFEIHDNSIKESALTGDNIYLGAKVTNNKKIKIYNKGKDRVQKLKSAWKQQHRAELAQARKTMTKYR